MATIRTKPSILLKGEESLRLHTGMRKVIFLISILIALLPIGCGRRYGIAETLRVAESVMEDRPDSAYALLQTIDGESVKRRKDKALHALLLTQAADKNYINQTNDSLITVAVDYFGSGKDEHYKMLSYYYLAQICYYSQDYARGVVNLLKAEEAGKNCGDDFYLGMIYGSFSQIFNK